MKKALFTISLFAALFLSACGTQETEEKVVTVGVIKIGEAQSSYSKSYLGTVKAHDSQILFSTYNGTVESLNVRVGQKVAKGKLVAKICSPNVISVNNANQATLRQAEDGYARAKKVYEGGGMSEVKWMEVQTKLAQAKSAAEISAESIKKCEITAPFNGTISDVYVNAGQEISPLERIAKIIDESKLEVAVGIPESEYSLVKVGDEAEIIVSALNDLSIKATISEVGVNSTRLSHSYIAILTLKSYPSSLKSGMACRAFLQCNKENRVIVPSHVVKVDDNGRYVWVVNSESRVEKRYVKTMGFAENGVAIRSGLDNGDLVVDEGMAKISGGMKVNAKLDSAE